MTAQTVRSTPGARTARHATFVVERLLDAPPARVFSAWADPRAKARWFGGPPGQWAEVVREHEFRVGGRERVVGRFAGTGTVSAFRAVGSPRGRAATVRFYSTG